MSIKEWFVRNKVMVVVLSLILVLTIMPANAKAAPSIGFTFGAVNNMFVDESNNVYLIGPSQFAKYTYSTGTWSGPTNMGRTLDSVVYKNGIFHGIYLSGTTLYYTTTTNPASWPAGTAIQTGVSIGTIDGYDAKSTLILNVNSANRYAVFFASGGRNISVISNYTGSVVRTNFTLTDYPYYTFVSLIGNDNSFYFYYYDGFDYYNRAYVSS